MQREKILLYSKVANPITIDTFPPGLLASIALIIFGALGDNRDFMPDWENNYLSWSFGLAFVGAVAGKLFCRYFDTHFLGLCAYQNFCSNDKRLTKAMPFYIFKLESFRILSHKETGTRRKPGARKIKS